MNTNNTELQLELFTVCDFASVTREGKVNILGIFDEVRNVRPPIVVNGFLVATLTGSPHSSYSVVFKVESGEKSQNAIPPRDLNFTTGESGTHNILMQTQLELPHHGDYRFKIYWNEKELGSKRIKVKKVEHEEKTEKIIN